MANNQDAVDDKSAVSVGEYPTPEQKTIRTVLRDYSGFLHLWRA